jgi:ureidoacrylate peracid hydrolase
MTRKAAADNGTGGLTRNRPIFLRKSVLLVIDVQHFCCFPGQGEWKHVDPQNIPEDMKYYFDRVEHTVLPNIKRLQRACRENGVEVMFTVIRCLTEDCREQGLDYKISGFMIPRSSPEAEIPVVVAPVRDEIVLPKTSSSVFNSTNIDYVLRGLETDYLMITGLITDQCVESAVRDACDKNYLVTLITDACTTYSQELHDSALRAMKGYCRQISTEEMIEEITTLGKGLDRRDR